MSFLHTKLTSLQKRLDELTHIETNLDAIIKQLREKHRADLAVITALNKQSHDVLAKRLDLELEIQHLETPIINEGIDCEREQDEEEAMAAMEPDALGWAEEQRYYEEIGGIDTLFDPGKEVDY